MSYSFNVKAPNKVAAKVAVEQEFDKVVEAQPEHARDKSAVVANANAVIDLLADDDTLDVMVGCNGYIAWKSGPDGIEITQAGVTCNAAQSVRDAEKDHG